MATDLEAIAATLSDQAASSSTKLQTLQDAVDDQLASLDSELTSVDQSVAAWNTSLDRQLSSLNNYVDEQVASLETRLSIAEAALLVPDGSSSTLAGLTCSHLYRHVSIMLSGWYWIGISSSMSIARACLDCVMQTRMS